MFWDAITSHLFRYPRHDQHQGCLPQVSRHPVRFCCKGLLQLQRRYQGANWKLGGRYLGLQGSSQGRRHPEHRWYWPDLQRSWRWRWWLQGRCSRQQDCSRHAHIRTIIQPVQPQCHTLQHRFCCPGLYGLRLRWIFQPPHQPLRQPVC
uniref:Endochitinase n=1 Tax=Hypocrea atroviridis TaxID=63577 RepID=G8GV19_HYPAT|nr:endochitinase [Trichoderma atroviride]